MPEIRKVRRRQAQGSQRLRRRCFRSSLRSLRVQPRSSPPGPPFSLSKCFFFLGLGVFLFSRSITWLYAQKSESAATAKNRATAVAINAEIRRIKARLLEEVPKLQRLAHKKVISRLF